MRFCHWNGSRAMAHGKKKKLGRAERERPAIAYFGEAYCHARSGLPKGRFAPDDLLEAFAALRTAERIAKGGPLVTPPNPRIDRFGLRMEIVASRCQELNDARSHGAGHAGLGEIIPLISFYSGRIKSDDRSAATCDTRDMRHEHQL